MDKTHTHLSKTISYALRHNPKAFGLTLDPEGWVSLEALLAALSKDRGSPVSLADINYILANSEKKRFEIQGSKIRATYGHSVPDKVDLGKPAAPPETLFHGTSAKAFHDHIEHEGLKPMSRQMVHLSKDFATARKVASRHSKDIIIIAIDSSEMWKDGINFYRTANDGTWLCDFVDPKYFLDATNP